MNQNNITKIVVALIVVVGIGYFLTVNMGNNHMVDDEHHDDDRVESHEIYPGDVADKIANNGEMGSATFF